MMRRAPRATGGTGKPSPGWMNRFSPAGLWLLLLVFLPLVSPLLSPPQSLALPAFSLWMPFQPVQLLARPRVVVPPNPPVASLPESARALLASQDALQAFHQQAVVADLHVDPLLWGEDLAVERRVRRRAGMVDWAKMKRGGLDVAVFGLVTRGLPIINGFRLFTLWRGWPGLARRSPWEAAQYQLRSLDQYLQRSGGQVVRVSDEAALQQALARGQQAVMLGVEGAHALDGELSRVDALARAGVLYMGPVHLAGNALAGSSYPRAGTGGVTAYGWQVIRAMERAGIWIDLAHLSPTAFWEVVRGTTGPLLCSHTGVSGVFPHWRNLDDDQLRAIAARDGLIGIMAAPEFLGGRGLEVYLTHIRHAVAVVGINHVAIGSDLDGFIVSSNGLPDVSRLPNLTRLLLLSGYTAEEVRGLMGGNFVAMLHRFRPTPVSVSSRLASTD